MTLEDSHPVRVLLVDDQEIVRAGLRSVLGTANIAVVGEAATVAEAIDEAARLNPDVILMDIRLPDGSGVDACREIRAANPQIKILFLSAFADEETLLATVFASADGYLLKEIGAATLVQAVNTVASGLSVMNPDIARPIMDRLRAFAIASHQEIEGEPLSKQEQRVLEFVAQGKTNREIGEAMGLSSKTVKNYLSRVFQKLQVTRRSEAVARLLRGRTP
jgi:two-component system, NarL family, response regulator DevR